MRIRPASKKLHILYKKSRYKVLMGGRSSSKSWGVVEALLYYATNFNIRIFCAREVQKSIRESSYRLILDTINRLEIMDDFDWTRDEILCKSTGSRFIFGGLKNNPDQIKSLENISICWVEESSTLSQESLDILLPTIRAKGSEIWFTYNPRLPSDPISKMFQSGRLPPDTLISHINYDDNPYLPQVIKDQIAYDKENFPSKYNHIWLGQFADEGDDLLIPMKYVVAAQQRKPIRLNVPVVAGLDVARFGNDRSCLVVRRGNEILAVKMWAGIPLDQLHDKVVSEYTKYNIDHIIVDGVGVGGGLVDNLKRTLKGSNIIEFNGGFKATDSHYLNARAETWCQMKDWLKDSGSIPVDVELQDQLTTISYFFNSKTQLQLESKDSMRKRGVKSPDIGDGLAMTFYKSVGKQNNILSKMYGE